jgi:hypothetical protein
MDFMDSPFLIMVVAIVGVFTYSIVRSIASARVRELEVRERIAMIERGLVPPPEKDPQGFDRAMNRYDRLREQYDDGDWYPRRRATARFRTAGVTLIGVGFGLMLMISVAGGAIEAGIGVGGFLVMIGLAFFVNSWLSRDDAPPRPPSSSSFTSPSTPASSAPLSSSVSSSDPPHTA